MSKQRKLFVPIEIKATSGIHSLLERGQVPTIGYITDKKRYTEGGGCIIPREVCFHYGTEHSDFFYFENMTLTYHCVTIETPEYLTDVYSRCVNQKNISPDKFIKIVVETYVFSSLGF